MRVVERQRTSWPNARKAGSSSAARRRPRGYYNNPSANAALFDGDWLNTGDLGYFAAGELYLTGRVKDIIIRRGVNIHPADSKPRSRTCPACAKEAWPSLPRPIGATAASASSCWPKCASTDAASASGSRRPSRDSRSSGSACRPTTSCLRHRARC